MKVIKAGKPKEKTRRKTCRNCGCVFEYSERDVKTETDPRDGYSESWVICPQKGCREKLAIR